MNFTSELFSIADTLLKKFEELDSSILNRVIREAEEVGKSWSGSCLGYHSRVYYKNLIPVPPGARFSKEWGFKDSWPINDTVGDWIEFDFDDIVNTIKERADNIDFDTFEKMATNAKECFEEAQSQGL